MNSSQREITHIISVNTSVDIRIPTYKIRSITTNNIKQLLNTIKYHYVQSKKGQIKKMLFLIHTGPKKNQNHRKIVRPRTTPDQRTSVRTMLNWAVRRFLPIRIILLVRKMFLHKEIELTSPQDMIGRQEIFRMEIFRFPYFFIFSDHGIKSGLRPMLNCIFHTAISCWYAVSCIPK